MKVTKMVKKAIEWYCESAALMYRVNDTEHYHEI